MTFCLYFDEFIVFTCPSKVPEKNLRETLNKTFQKIFLTLAVIWCCVGTMIIVYDARNKILNKISLYSLNLKKAQLSNEELANEILKEGGYILFFRHAEREKWIDVAMYDALEANHLPNAEDRFYEKAVCLSSKGKIQARAMGEVIRLLNLPVSSVVSSPSCRARQTAELVFGKYDNLNKVLVYKGPFLENENKRKEFLIYLLICRN